METLDKPPLYIYPQEKIDEITLRAAEVEVFQEAINGSRGKLEAITKVRGLIPDFFPEVNGLKPAQRTDAPNIVGGRQRNLLDKPLSNDFLIARSLVNLLWEDK